MEQAGLLLQGFAGPLLGGAEVPANAEDQPPSGGADEQVVFDDVVRQALGGNVAFLTEFQQIDEFLARIVQDGPFKVAETHQVVAECHEQQWPVGVLELGGLGPEGDQGHEREDEAPCRQDQGPELDGLLLAGIVHGIDGGATLRDALVVLEAVVGGAADRRGVVMVGWGPGGTWFYNGVGMHRWML